MPISQIVSNSLGSALTFTGQQTIPTINLTGGQITFPATQNPSSNANTLDDYEEGTWTPGWLNIGTGTYFTRQGRYIKIGNLVMIECYLALNTLGSASGDAILTGLPFSTTVTGATCQMWTNNWVSSGQNVIGLTDIGTRLFMYNIPSSGLVSAIQMSNLGNQGNVVFNMCYSAY